MPVFVYIGIREIEFDSPKVPKKSINIWLNDALIFTMTAKCNKYNINKILSRDHHNTSV